jgi:hypothetical protein
VTTRPRGSVVWPSRVQVYGRRNGKRVHVPADQWLWTRSRSNESIVSMDTWWEAAQAIGAEHSTSRDSDPEPAPLAGSTPTGPASTAGTANAAWFPCPTPAS